MATNKTNHNDNSPPPGSKALRKGRRSEPFGCYSITTNHCNREPILAVPAPAEIIFNSFDYLRKDDQFRLLGFCIMPDHLHMIFVLLQKKDLSQVMKSFGAFTAKRNNELLHRSGQFWQDGFHDHRCRGDQDIEDRIVYAEHNPVRSGLVEKAQDWPYSSATPQNQWLLDKQWYADHR